METLRQSVCDRTKWGSDYDARLSRRASSQCPPLIDNTTNFSRKFYRTNIYGCRETWYQSTTTLNSDILDTTTDTTVDVEKGASCTIRQCLGIAGMGSSESERKVLRALESSSGLSNVRISIASARVSFDHDSTTDGATLEIIDRIEKTTGLACWEIEEPSASLDLFVNSSARAYINTERDVPFGVKSLQKTGKQTVRVVYDPQVLGARDLLAHPVFASAMLAPMNLPLVVRSGRRDLVKTFIATLISTFLTIPVLIMAWAPLPSHTLLYSSLSLGLATIVQLLVVGPFFIRSMKTMIKTYTIDPDFLIVLSTTAAWVYSIVAYVCKVHDRPLPIDNFFQTSTLLITFTMFGRLIRAYSIQKALESSSSSSSLPSVSQSETAILQMQGSDKEQEVDARLLHLGDLVTIYPGNLVVTDGIIVQGQTELNEAIITGENRFVRKSVGMPVIAGSRNKIGIIRVRVTNVVSENTLSCIQGMIDSSLTSKSRLQIAVNWFVARFVLAVLAFSLITFAIWTCYENLVRHHTSAEACIQAMTYAIAVLIIVSPCAIGLVVPMTCMHAVSLAVKHGLLCRTSTSLELARKVTHVVFAKTSTLTQGHLSVVSQDYCCDDDEDQKQQLAAAILGLIMTNTHPVSAAITKHLQKTTDTPATIADIHKNVDQGLEGRWGDQRIRVGSPHWLDVEDLAPVRPLLATGLTVMAVSLDERLVAVFGLQDRVRPEAMTVIKDLQDQNIQVSLLSGDNTAAVNAVANQLSIPFSHVRAQCNAESKQAYVSTALFPTSGIQPVVLYCGDGMYDTSALAQASIGMHVSPNANTTATEIARAAADVILLRQSLEAIPELIRLSKAVHRRVVISFAWLLLFNILALLLATGALTHGIRITPQWAGLGEAVATIPVIMISLSLKWVRLSRS